MLIFNLKKCVFVIVVVLSFGVNLYSQTDTTSPFIGIPYISSKDYEPPLYDIAKRLWLPDSVIAKETNAIPNQWQDNKLLNAILYDTSCLNKDKRRECFQKLSYYDDPVVFKTFSRVLMHDSDNVIKSICIRKLGKKVTPEGVAALVETVKSVYDLRQKIDLAKSLVSVGQYNLGFNQIINIYNVVNTITQIDFLYFIRKLPISETREFLFETQKNSNPYVAATASLVLAQLNEKDSAFF